MIINWMKTMIKRMKMCNLNNYNSSQKKYMIKE